MGDWTGTVPSHASGAKSKASKLQTLDDIATALTGAWSTWTPTLTNLTKGNGTVVARYRRLNKTVDWFWQFLLGSTSSVGTNPQFTLPFTPAANYLVTNPQFPGGCHLLQTGATERQGQLKIQSGATIVINFWNATPAAAAVTATAPFTWVTGNYMTAWGTFETT